MRVLTTVLKPTQGTASLDGLTYSKENYGKIRRKIGYLPQEIDLYPQLTVRECLEYMGELAGVEKKVLARRIDRALERTSLTAHQKKKMRQLSGGMKRRVGLVQALLHEPEFLIVDEPTTGWIRRREYGSGICWWIFRRTGRCCCPPMWWRIWLPPAAGWR